MLRPATPLTILLLAAFALLLISSLSTPIIRGIPLASEAGVDFGVFGFCNGTQCSAIQVGYSTDGLTKSENNSFDLPSTKLRKRLATILVIHPVAALFVLIMLVMAISAHFHSPSHSPRFLLCLFIFGIFTFVLGLLAFLVDVLVFAPHMKWGAWIVLAADILIAISGIVSCAMRRTLVSRKARKKRIAQNAEMNGENYQQNRLGGATIPPIASALVSGGLGETKDVASFEMHKTNTDPSRTSDERIPLTARTPTNRSPNESSGKVSSYGNGMNEGYGGPPMMGPPRGGMNGNGGRPYNGPRDEFGNPLPPSAAFGGPRPRDPSQESLMRNQYPQMRGRGGPVMRGRGGGYGPPGRGGYGPPGGRGGYGPPPGRGGYGPGPNYRGGMMGGGMPAGMMGRGRGPPPGYSNGYNGPPPQGYPRNPSPPRGDYDGGYDGGMSYGRRPSEPNAPPYNIGRNPSPNPPNTQGYVAYRSSRSNSLDLPRAESPPPLPGMSSTPPPPIGQAVELDATTGSPSHTPVGFGSYNNGPGALRDSDGDVAGMVGLQQSGLPAHLRQNSANDRVKSDTSFYSSDEPYVPPPQAWGDAGPPLARKPSPLSLRNNSPNPSQPAELPAPAIPNQEPKDSSEDYYEDVDPKFAEPEPRRSTSAQSHANSHANSLHAGSQRAASRQNNSPPPLQVPGPHVPGVAAYNPNLVPPQTNTGGLHPMPTYDGEGYDDEPHGFPSGSRSPAESDGGVSTFTSISQRGVNPRWQGDRGGGNFIPRRPLPKKNDQDILLNSNPDFELPGLGPIGRGFNGRGNGGTRGGSATVRGGLIGGGPYPGQ